jgi:tRNA(Ile)-lysidine synthase
MTLPGSRGSRSVKRLCAERGISPTERDTLPDLRINGGIAAMAHLGTTLEFAPRSDEKAVYIRFEKNNKGR